jgi:tetratricopeptide (TPR) repeat protein/tRNA A-37 threonylcarbamoyl transferase component Bud32
MPDLPDPELTIFSAARRLPPSQRAAYLDEASSGDAELRQRVEELLKAGEEAGGFLTSPVAVPPKPEGTIRLVLEPAEKPGDQIGRYKLLQQIGEGGCGVVYMAEQEEPVRRRVALKVIKLGMDTKSVIARFEAERQALAMMDHPNIAKVLDAGATDKGRPYFVMELVRGIKITDYCDQNNLSTQARLDLFVLVCRAVQHAHQKGIIHRDIKPSNILVTMNDGVPVPKVIDFGIAKATQGKLTDHTLFTAFEQFIGTPAYMSPEQAEMSALDIDTRSDLYSLGVLLYELLTGKTPFDANELLRAGLDEMRRHIREQEPARPSTRLSTMLAADLTAVAVHRQSAAPKLIHLVRGELDWIVMKCLEKDRTRRYETANGLAADIQRHINNEPVLAGPPGAGYKIQKFVRRHRAGVMAGSFVLLALLAGIVGTTWGLVDALHQKREAERQGRIAKHTTEFLTGMFESIDPQEAKLREITVREILDQASGNIATAFPNDPMTELPIRRTMADIYDKLGKPDAALTNAEAALRLVQAAYGDKDSPEKATSFSDFAYCLFQLGRLDEALPKYETALAVTERIYQGDNTNRASRLEDVGICLASLDRQAEALPKVQGALEMWRRIYKGDNPYVAHCLFDVAGCLDDLDRSPEALVKWKEALSMYQRLFKGDHPYVALAMDREAACLDVMGRDAEALPIDEAALAMYQRIYKGDHPSVADCLGNIAAFLQRLRRFDEAESRYEAALAMYRRIYKADNAATEILLDHFASELDQSGRAADALSKYEECLAMCQRMYQGDRYESATALCNFGACLAHLGRFPEALTNFEASSAMLHRIFKWDNVGVANVCMSMGDAQNALGHTEQALQGYREAQAIDKRLTTSQPSNNAANIGLVRSSLKLGDLFGETGKTEEAKQYYRQGLDAAEAVLASDSANVNAKTLRLTCRVKLGLEKVEVVIGKISPRSQAEQVGLKEGDVLVRYGGKPVTCAADLTGRAAGNGIELEVRRDGAPLKLTVRAGPLGAICEDRILARGDPR